MRDGAMHQTTLRFSPDVWEAVELASGALGISAAQFVREATVARIAQLERSARPEVIEEQVVENLESTSALAAQSRLARARARELRDRAQVLRDRRLSLGRYARGAA